MKEPDLFHEQYTTSLSMHHLLFYVFQTLIYLRFIRHAPFSLKINISNCV